jgi:tight adherence protein B
MFLDAVARRVRTGSSLTAAVVDEIERSPPLRAAAEGLRRGDTLTVALARVEATDPDVALAVYALSAAARLGGPVSATLDQAASVVRERSAARAERHAHSAQARLSARVMTIVPVAFAGWNVASSETARAVYLTTRPGAAVAVAGMLLNIGGWRWMRKIVGPP